MATLLEILSLDKDERKRRFKADGIDRVLIDNNEFKGYGAFSFLWEKTYLRSPERSADGTIGNLNSYATFVTPHLKIDFSMMSIDDYRRLMILLYEKNEFTVQCYDIVHNRTVTAKMYFSTEEMPKLYTIARALNGEEWVELLGVQDYTVEMIGTNSSISSIDILYYDENGALIPEASQKAENGTEVIVGYNYIPSNPSVRFDGFWRRGSSDENAPTISNGSALQIASDASDIKLFAVTIPTDEYTLSFNYGNGDILYSKTAGEISSIKITKGQTISEAIEKANIMLPDGTTLTAAKLLAGTGGKKVTHNNTLVSPYDYYGWYWTTEKNTNTKISEASRFDYQINRTMYQLYEVKSYPVEYVTNDSSVSIDPINVKYGTAVPLPVIRRSDGYVHTGWYTDSNLQNRFSGNMPPQSLTLYAAWVKE